MENNGYIDEEIMIIDDDAYCESLIGVSSDMRAVYDRCIMIDEFAKHHECTRTKQWNLSILMCFAPFLITAIKRRLYLTDWKIFNKGVEKALWQPHSLRTSA